MYLQLCLQQYWYVVVYRIYGSRTRYIAGSQQIGRSPAVRRTRIHLGMFYIENLYETLCMVFMRDHGTATGPY
eukprot:SAG11_NODE_5191_length_1634_cov_6.827362_1_plen_73_part_00